jgi:hypothetical protein
MRHFGKEAHPPLKTYYLNHIHQNKTAVQHLDEKKINVVMPMIEGTFSMTKAQFNNQTEVEVEVQEKEEEEEEEKEEETEKCQLFEDRCMYSCTFCSFSYRSWTTMYNHYQREHPERYNCKRHKASMLMTGKVYHECAVCRMIVMCDRAVIRMHVRRKHGLSTADYECQLEACVASQQTFRSATKLIGKAT